MNQKGWALSRENLKSSLENAKCNGVSVRALVVINPGNPTGQILTEDNLKEIIQFLC